MKNITLLLLIMFLSNPKILLSGSDTNSSDAKISKEFLIALEKPSPGEIKSSNEKSKDKTTQIIDPAGKSILPQPPLVVKVYNDNPNKEDAGLGEYIIVKVNNLQQLVDSAKKNNTNIILFLDNRPIKELYPDFIDTDSNKVKFYLSRKKSAYEAWDPIFRKPNPFQVHKYIPISIGLEKGEPIRTNVKDSNSFPIIVIRPIRTVLASLFIVFVLYTIYRLARYRGMLCENVPDYAKPVKVPYSLAYCQMAFWFTIVIVFYLSLFLVLNELPALTPSVLILIGISSGTAIGARLLNSNNQNIPIETMNNLNAEFKMITDRITEIDNMEKQIPQPINISALIKEKENKQIRLNEISIIKSQSTFTFNHKESKGFIMDLLTDSDGTIAFNRFQIVIWTIVLGGIFIYNTWKDLAMPEFDNTLLGLMGISSGTYLGFKIPEQKK